MQLPCWEYPSNPLISEVVNSIEDMPDGVYGFVYRIFYEDGTIYIGKKNVYSIITMDPLKNGKVREGTIKQTYKVGSGKRIPKDIVKKESNWKTYCGSHKDVKDKVPSTREILAYAFNKIQLTYLEAKYQFSTGCLEDERYINDNILGSFYRGNIGF